MRPLLAVSADHDRLLVIISLVYWSVHHFLDLVVLGGLIFIALRLRQIESALAHSASETRNSVKDIQKSLTNIISSSAASLKEHITKTYPDSTKLTTHTPKIPQPSEILMRNPEWREKREQQRRRWEIERHRKAAEAGDVYQQFDYAWVLGLEGDFVPAHMWFDVAAARADDALRAAAAGQRDQIAMEMTAEEILEAGRRAKDWIETHPPPTA
jgi:hypothetical protein